MSGIQQMIERIRSLGTLGRDAAPDVAVVVEAELRRSIAEGRTPEGEPWRLTQKGEAPLRNAAKALRVAAVGGTVFARLQGPEAMHHKGTARGSVVRQVLPTSGTIPERMAAAIRGVLDRHFDEKARGNGG